MNSLLIASFGFFKWFQPHRYCDVLLFRNIALHYLILSDLMVPQGLTGLLGAPGAEGKQGPMVGDS